MSLFIKKVTERHQVAAKMFHIFSRVTFLYRSEYICKQTVLFEILQKQKFFTSVLGILNETLPISVYHMKQDRLNFMTRGFV